jgi:hypothetical protein
MPKKSKNRDKRELIFTTGWAAAISDENRIEMRIPARAQLNAPLRFICPIAEWSLLPVFKNIASVKESGTDTRLDALPWYRS